MAARPRAHSRPTRAPRVRKTRRIKTRQRLLRIEVGAVAVGAALIAALLFWVDVPNASRVTRDWLIETFGLGLAIVAAWSILGGMAISQRWYADRGWFMRQAVGVGAVGLFTWGALGLNEAHWTLWGVSFKEVSLGGRIGQEIIGGVLGKFAWLSLGVIAAALLAPNRTRSFVVSVPGWLREAWERRWPHQVAETVGRVAVWLFSRPPKPEVEEEMVIGGTLRQRLDPTAPAAMESPPRIFRPSIEPGAPSSMLGAGAAAQFGGGAAVEVSEPPQPEPPPTEAAPAAPAEEAIEPQQLGLSLAARNGWHLPAVELLNAPQVSTSRKHDNAARAQLIVDTLASFGVDATVVEINEGPTVTQFGVEPGWEVRSKDVGLKDESGKALLTADGRPRTERVEVARTRVRVNKITALQNDLALALAAPTLRIEAPVPGRAIVGIEVPNDSATVVTLRHVMETKEFADLEKKSKLAIALGKGVSGVPVVADLARMPHLLIAGATGSGKSVCMNAIIGGIMMNATPEEVRFVMIDPKRVELTPYSHIPHLAFSEVIVDMDKVVGTLQAVVSEMEARYKKFANVAVRNVESYNRHPRVLKKLPYWVVIIDELADLMMVAAFEVEKLLCRLAQLARATGIHLVVATQRPSVDVVTGLIKANFPTRIAFAVTSMTDSRTILDMGGAEKLLGRGDMLYMPTDAAKPIRIQGVYVSDTEVERLVQFWTDDRFKELAPENADALLEEALEARNGGDADMDVEEDDPVYEKARQLAMQHHRVSPSLFQRRLRVGYMKACKIIELLEEDRIVGPRGEGESREVLAMSVAIEGD